MGYLEQLIGGTNKVGGTTAKLEEIDLALEYVLGFNFWNLSASLQTGAIFRDGLMESSALVETSCFLALHGFYDQACAVLRQILDDFLVRLYFDLKNRHGRLQGWVGDNGRSDNEYNAWRLGGKEYPCMKNICSILFEEVPIKEYDKKHRLKEEILELHRTLSKYVHNRPRSRHYPGASRSSLLNIEFSKKNFDNWLEYLKDVFRIISILSILQYPELLDTEQGRKFETLEPALADNIKQALSLSTSG